QGTVNVPDGATVLWKLYSGPNECVIADPGSAATAVSFSQSGTYMLELSADDGVHAVAYDAVIVSVAGDERLTNISTRVALGTSENVSIGGFIIQGGAPETILIRALGPSLAAFGVSGPLADPTLELHDSSGNLIATNDNWQDTQKE